MNEYSDQKCVSAKIAPKQSEVPAAITRTDDSVREVSSLVDNLFDKLDQALKPVPPQPNKDEARMVASCQIEDRLIDIEMMANSTAERLRILLSRIAL